MKGNWPWFIVVAGNFFFWVAQQGRQQSMVYYFTYYFHNKDLVTLFNSIAIIQVIGWLIANIGSGIAVSMPFAMLGSSVDYGEWKSGINAAGLLTTIGSVFCMSMGQGIAGALNSKIMAAFGYVAGHTQTLHALSGIKISFN